MSLGSAPQIDWQADWKMPLPTGVLRLASTQSWSVWPSSLAASLDFQGALTPTLAASPSSASAARMSPWTSLRVGRPGVAG